MRKVVCKIIMIFAMLFVFALPADAQTASPSPTPSLSPTPKPKLITWGGLYVSVDRTAPITETRLNRRDFSIAVLVILPFRKSRFAFQFQLIKPISSQPVIFRVGGSVRLF